MHCNVHEPKSNPNFRVLTRNVEENQILHEKFLKASRFPLYISCYISENRLPLGQCAQLCIYLCIVGCICIFNIIRLPCLDPSNWLYTLTPRQEPISSFREPFVIGWDNNTCRYREGWQGLDGSVSNKRSTPPPPPHTERAPMANRFTKPFQCFIQKYNGGNGLWFPVKDIHYTLSMYCCCRGGEKFLIKFFKDSVTKNYGT